jgi:hypothetical protein
MKNRPAGTDTCRAFVRQTRALVFKAAVLVFPTTAAGAEIVSADLHDGAVLLLIGKDTESPPRRIPVNGKAPAVKRQNIPDAERLTHGDKRSIRVIHRDVGIFRHQVSATTAGLSIFSPVESPASELRCILLARQVHLLGALSVTRIGVFKKEESQPNPCAESVIYPLSATGIV